MQENDCNLKSTLCLISIGLLGVSIYLHCFGIVTLSFCSCSL